MLSFSGKTLNYNGRETTLLYDIKDAVETPFGAVVLIDPRFVSLDRNIFLVDCNGSVKWQVELLNDNGLIKAGTQPYTSIAFQDGKIKAFNFLCFSCVLAPETGAVLEAEFTR